MLIRSEVIIFVVERQSNGASRRILATELYAVLSQDNIKVCLFYVIYVLCLNCFFKI